MRGPRKRSFFVRLTGSVLSVVYFCTQVAFASAPERTLWSQRRASTQRFQEQLAMASLPESAAPFPPTRLGLPSAVPPSFPTSSLSSLVALLSVDATVRDVRPAGTTPAGREAPVIVYIQDVHGEREAQKHIASLILALLRRDPSTVVGLEGASGRIPIESFRRGSPAVNREIGSFFLNTGLITGAEYAGFAAERAPRLVGLEDPALYRHNIDAVRAALREQKARLAVVLADEAALQRRKDAVYSPALRAFDRDWRGYHAGTLDVGAYLTSLAALSPPSRRYPEIRRFEEAWRLEKDLDFPRAERERDAFLSQLAGRLGGAALDELLRRTLALRAGALAYPDYYRALRSTAARAGLSLSSTPEFDRYVTYVLAADAIRPERFLAEVGSYEDDVAATLCRTPAQRALAAASTRLGLTEKLVRLTLTPPEWNAFKTARRADSFTSFEAFYDAAEARNAALASRFTAARAASGARVAVLVAGGYHSEGLQRLLAGGGATFITLTPKLTRPTSTQDNPYLNVFTQDKTPLEKLFAAPRISLVKPLATGDPSQPAVRRLTAEFAPLVEEELRTGAAARDRGNHTDVAVGPGRALPDRDRPVLAGETETGARLAVYAANGASVWVEQWKYLTIATLPVAAVGVLVPLLSFPWLLLAASSAVAVSVMILAGSRGAFVSSHSILGFAEDLLHFQDEMLEALSHIDEFGGHLVSGFGGEGHQVSPRWAFINTEMVPRLRRFSTYILDQIHPEDRRSQDLAENMLARLFESPVIREAAIELIDYMREREEHEMGIFHRVLQSFRQPHRVRISPISSRDVVQDYPRYLTRAYWILGTATVLSALAISAITPSLLPAAFVLAAPDVAAFVPFLTAPVGAFLIGAGVHAVFNRYFEWRKGYAASGKKKKKKKQSAAAEAASSRKPGEEASAVVGSYVFGPTSLDADLRWLTQQTEERLAIVRAEMASLESPDSISLEKEYLSATEQELVDVARWLETFRTAAATEEGFYAFVRANSKAPEGALAAALHATRRWLSNLPVDRVRLVDEQSRLWDVFGTRDKETNGVLINVVLESGQIVRVAIIRDSGDRPGVFRDRPGLFREFKTALHESLHLLFLPWNGYPNGFEALLHEGVTEYITILIMQTFIEKAPDVLVEALREGTSTMPDVRGQDLVSQIFGARPAGIPSKEEFSSWAARQILSRSAYAKMVETVYRIRIVAGVEFILELNGKRSFDDLYERFPSLHRAKDFGQSLFENSLLGQDMVWSAIHALLDDESRPDSFWEAINTVLGWFARAEGMKVSYKTAIEAVPGYDPSDPLFAARRLIAETAAHMMPPSFLLELAGDLSAGTLTEEQALRKARATYDGLVRAAVEEIAASDKDGLPDTDDVIGQPDSPRSITRAPLGVPNFGAGDVVPGTQFQLGRENNEAQIRSLANWSNYRAYAESLKPGESAQSGFVGAGEEFVEVLVAQWKVRRALGIPAAQFSAWLRQAIETPGDVVVVNGQPIRKDVTQYRKADEVTRGSQDPPLPGVEPSSQDIVLSNENTGVRVSGVLTHVHLGLIGQWGFSESGRQNKYAVDFVELAALFTGQSVESVRRNMAAGTPIMAAPAPAAAPAGASSATPSASLAPPVPTTPAAMPAVPGSMKDELKKYAGFRPVREATGVTADGAAIAVFDAGGEKYIVVLGRGDSFDTFRVQGVLTRGAGIRLEFGGHEMYFGGFGGTIFDEKPIASTGGYWIDRPFYRRHLAAGVELMRNAALVAFAITLHAGGYHAVPTTAALIGTLAAMASVPLIFKYGHVPGRGWAVTRNDPAIQHLTRLFAWSTLPLLALPWFPAAALVAYAAVLVPLTYYHHRADNPVARDVTRAADEAGAARTNQEVGAFLANLLGPLQRDVLAKWKLTGANAVLGRRLAAQIDVARRDAAVMSDRRALRFEFGNALYLAGRAGLSFRASRAIVSPVMEELGAGTLSLRMRLSWATGRAIGFLVGLGARSRRPFYDKGSARNLPDRVVVGFHVDPLMDDSVGDADLKNDTETHVLRRIETFDAREEAGRPSDVLVVRSAATDVAGLKDEVRSRIREIALARGGRAAARVEAYLAKVDVDVQPLGLIDPQRLLDDVARRRGVRPADVRFDFYTALPQDIDMTNPVVQVVVYALLSGLRVAPLAQQLDAARVVSLSA